MSPSSITAIPSTFTTSLWPTTSTTTPTASPLHPHRLIFSGHSSPPIIMIHGEPLGLGTPAFTRVMEHLGEEYNVSRVHTGLGLVVTTSSTQIATPSATKKKLETRRGRDEGAATPTPPPRMVRSEEMEVGRRQEGEVEAATAAEGLVIV